MTNAQSNRRRPRSLPRLDRLDPRVLFAAITFTGSGDGSSWTDANNWDLSRIPDASDDVTIASSFSVHLTGNQSASQLDLSGQLHIDGAQLTLFGRTLDLGTGGQLFIGDSAANAPSSTLAFNNSSVGGFITGTGNLTFGSSAGNELLNSLSDPGGSNPSAANLLVGFGVSVSGSGFVFTTSSATTIFTGSLTVGATDNFSFDGDLTDGGTIDVQGGTLSFTGGDFLIQSGSAVNVTSGSVTFGGTLSDHLTNESAISVSGNSTVSFGGTFAFPDLGTINRSGGGELRIDGTLQGDLPLSDATGSFTLGFGTLSHGTFSATGSATLIARGGALDSYSIASPLTLTGGVSVLGNLNLVGGVTVTLGNASAAGGLEFTSTDPTASPSVLGNGILLFGSGSAGLSGFIENFTNFTSTPLPGASAVTFAQGITITGNSGVLSASSATDGFVLLGSLLVQGSAGQEFLISSPVTVGATGVLSVDSGTASLTGKVTVLSGGAYRLTGGFLLFDTNVSQGDLAAVARTGGNFVIGDVFTGDLTASDSTGDVVVFGGSFSHATLSTAGSAVIRSALGDFDSCTIAGTLVVSDPSHFASASFSNALTLSGANVIMGDASDPTATGYDQLDFQGTNLASGFVIAGTGTILGAGASTNGLIDNLTSSATGAHPVQTQVTIPSGVTVAGQNLTFYTASTDNGSGGTIAGSGSFLIAGTVSFNPGTNDGYFEAYVSVASSGSVIANAPFNALFGFNSAGNVILTSAAHVFASDASNLSPAAFVSTGIITFQVESNDTYAYLNVATGTAALSGTLNVIGPNQGTNVASGTNAQIVTAASLNAQFSATNIASGLTLAATSTSITVFNDGSSGGGGGGSQNDGTIGGVDTSFGGGSGTVTVSIPQVLITAVDSYVERTTTQTYTAGLDLSAHNLVITRFNADGSTDASFGANGVATVAVDARARRVQFDPVTGNIYVLATNADGVPTAFRFDRAGNADSTFGTNGTLTISALPAGAQVNAILPFADKTGGFLVGGSTTSGGARAAVVLRVTAAGALNPKFGTKGYYTYSSGAADTVATVSALAFGAKNVIYAVGVTSRDSGATTQALAAKLSAAGKPDKSFTKASTLAFSVPGYTSAAALKISVQTDGKADSKLLLTTAVSNASTDTPGIAVVRLLVKGAALDPTFNATGVLVVRQPAGNSPSSLHHLVLADVNSGADAFLDSSAASVVQVPGGKVRSIAADTAGTSTTITQTQIIADAANVSVVGGALTVANKKPYKPAAKTSVKVKVSNTGTLVTPPTCPVTVYFSPDAVLSPGADPSVVLQNVKLGLKASASKSLSLSVNAPSDVGSYYVFVVLNDGAGAYANDLKTSDNTASATGAITVAAATKTGKSELLTSAPTADLWHHLFAAKPILA